MIFCQTPEQRADAEAVIAELTRQKLWRDPIVTEIAGAAMFYPAEGYHQDYFARNAYQPYCQASWRRRSRSSGKPSPTG